MKKLWIALACVLVSCSFYQQKPIKKGSIPIQPDLTVGNPDTEVVCLTDIFDSEELLCKALKSSIVKNVPAIAVSDTPPEVMKYIVKVNSIRYDPYFNKDGTPVDEKKCAGVCSYAGTGTIIAPGFVFTDQHVIEDSLYVTITLQTQSAAGDWQQDPSPVLMKVEKTGYSDYAFLMVAHPEDKARFPKGGVKIGYGIKPPIGATVWHFGKTTGPQKGKVLDTQTHACARLNFYTPMDIKIDFGDSGGSIFYGDVFFGYVIRLNSEVCQGNLYHPLKDIGVR